MLLKIVHCWVITTTDTSSFLITFGLTSLLARVEVCSAQMCGSVIVGTVLFLVATMLALSKELAVW